MAKDATYGETVRQRMRELHWNRRDLERRLKELDPSGTGYSYEHIRRVAGGQAVMSEQFNRDVCKVLGLDEENLWRLAARDKLKASKYAFLRGEIVSPNLELQSLWSQLTPDNQKAVVQLVKGMVEGQDGKLPALEDEVRELRRKLEALEKGHTTAKPGKPRKKQR